MEGSRGYERPGIAGSGTIASSLAACATLTGEVRLLARSDASAWRAEEQAHKLCSKLDGADAKRIKVTTSPATIAGCDLIVEAIVEERDAKADLLASLAEVCPDADLATTTSSLSITELGESAAIAERFYGLHVFNPVTKMELVELCLPPAVGDDVRVRARAFCDALGKHAVEVPDHAGFVVNRLLFPYLFDAVRLLEQTGMKPEEVDRCMTLGAAYPMGPLALLDLVGLDVAEAIGDALHAETSEPHHRPPGWLVALTGEGKLGRKSGEGFYRYD